MFVWECIKSEGTHVGVCVDTFMFGSCCVHNATANSIGSSGSSAQQVSSPSGRPPAARPSLAEALAASEVVTTTVATTMRPSTTAAVQGSGRPASTSHFSVSQAVSQGELFHILVGDCGRCLVAYSGLRLQRPLVSIVLFGYEIIIV